MDYENLYKDANNKVAARFGTNVAKEIFADLYESDDERIRKEILEYIDKATGCKEWIAWLKKQNHDGKKWMYEDVYLKEKEQLIQDGIDEVLENPQKYGLEKQGETFTKRDIDDAYLKGICDAKRELEKQDDTNETINKDKFAQDVLRGAAINLITWIDYNAAEGNICLSNMECKDIEDALVSGDWDKIYAYIKKKLEKQSEQNQKHT